MRVERARRLVEDDDLGVARPGHGRCRGAGAALPRAARHARPPVSRSRPATTARRRGGARGFAARSTPASSTSVRKKRMLSATVPANSRGSCGTNATRRYQLVERQRSAHRARPRGRRRAWEPAAAAPAARAWTCRFRTARRPRRSRPARRRTRGRAAPGRPGSYSNETPRNSRQPTWPTGTPVVGMAAARYRSSSARMFSRKGRPPRSARYDVCSACPYDSDRSMMRTTPPRAPRPVSPSSKTRANAPTTQRSAAPWYTAGTAAVRLRFRMRASACAAADRPSCSTAASSTPNSRISRAISASSVSSVANSRPARAATADVARARARIGRSAKANTVTAPTATRLGTGAAMNAAPSRAPRLSAATTDDDERVEQPGCLLRLTGEHLLQVALALPGLQVPRRSVVQADHRGAALGEHGRAEL